MKSNGNVIDLSSYRDELNHQAARVQTAISEELEKAIQLLIHQLRVLGPITPK